MPLVHGLRFDDIGGDVYGGTPAAVPDLVRAALVLALLGSIDSLPTSLIADNVTQTFHDSDRELIGQGIGNTVAGLFGATPGAGATMGTVVTVRAGGGDRRGRPGLIR